MHAFEDLRSSRILPRSLLSNFKFYENFITYNIIHAMYHTRSQTSYRAQPRLHYLSEKHIFPSRIPHQGTLTIQHRVTLSELQALYRCKVPIIIAQYCAEAVIRRDTLCTIVWAVHEVVYYCSVVSLQYNTMLNYFVSIN